ncbi:MAG: hypothetical protein RIB01_05570 [Balneola sp.]
MSSKKKVKVFTHNRHFTGQRLSVQFENGVGEATKEQAKLLVNDWGYYCPAISKTKNAPEWLEEEAEENDTDQRPISATAKNDDLKAFMEENDIAYESDDNKKDLNAKIDAWLEAKSNEDPEESSDEDPEESSDEDPEESSDEDPEESSDEDPEESSDEDPEESSDEDPEETKDENPEQTKKEKTDK